MQFPIGLLQFQRCPINYNIVIKWSSLHFCVFYSRLSQNVVSYYFFGYFLLSFIIFPYVCQGGKIGIHIFLDKPVTMRPKKTRVDLGKGSLEYWVSIIKPNRIFYEISGVSKIVAKAAMKIAAYKMPIRTQFVIVISDKNMNDG